MFFTKKIRKNVATCIPHKKRILEETMYLDIILRCFFVIGSNLVRQQDVNVKQRGKCENKIKDRVYLSTFAQIATRVLKPLGLVEEKTGKR